MSDEHEHNPGEVHSHEHPHQDNSDGRKHVDHQAGHGHDEPGHGGKGHGHSHGIVDSSLLATKKGLWAIRWSFAGLFLTTLIQIVIVYYSNSMALLADTIHNLGDASTAIPLALAFVVGKRKPTKRFTYGYGRIEDLAGVAVVLTILASAAWTGYASIQRLIHPKAISHLLAIAVGSIVGFVGNEGVAIFRIRVGREMGSAALVADGYHARTDGFASLSVLLSVIGVRLGYSLADPIIGILMTFLILKIVWESATVVFTRLLDGVDPEVVDQLRSEAGLAHGVKDVSDVRIRWLGHRMHAEINVAVDEGLSVEQGHAIATAVRHDLLHRLKFLNNVTVHIDPLHISGEEHHSVNEHEHDEKPPHSHA